MAAISKQLDELLLWLRSERTKRENLQVDAPPYSSQLSDSSGFNRPDPKPIYEIKADKDIPKASSKSKRIYKLQKRISCEELDERTMKGLCVFCEEPETPGHYLQHMNSCLLMIDSEDHLSDSMVNKIGNEISSDSNSIGCELEIGETDKDEDRVPSDSDLVVNDIEKVKKDLVAVDVDSETNLLIENNQQFQEQAKNRFTNSVLQHSLVPQLCSLLKEQVQEAQEENSRVENHKNWVQHVLLEEDSTIHFHEPVSKSENLRKMEVNSVLNNREAVVGVVKRFRQVTSVTKKFSTRQLFATKFKDKERLKGKKRRKPLKSWRFKFKSRDLRGYNLSRVKLLLKNSLVITGSWRWFMIVKGYEQCHMLEHANIEAESFPLLSFAAEPPFLWMENKSELVLTVSALERKKKKLCYKTRMFKYKVPLDRVQFLHYCDKEFPLETNWAVQRIWDKDSPEVMRNKKIKFSKRWWFKYKAPNLDIRVFETSGQCIRKRLFVCADCGTENNKHTLRFLMVTKQYRLSLQANRVWDPGGSNSEND